MLRRFGTAFTFLSTEAVGHATELARQAALRGDKTVIAVGGDGTVNEVAAGLIGTDTALGIIPAGNGNDFAKALGVPKGWEAALDYLLKQAPIRVDTATANDRVFINISGTGFDVMVLENMLKAKQHLRGKLPYLYGIFVTLTRFKSPRMRIETAEGEHIDKPCAHFSVANGQYFGSGIHIMPLSKLDDGLLDVLVIDALSRFQIFLNLPALLKGTIIRKPFTHHYRTKECTLSAPNMRLNLDGEIMDASEVKFVCRPASLLVHAQSNA
ncbi:MAG: diacylglycerol kinase family lipid kinase [Firmicutes bacterium]|nr:diacylglycerol kinase family lipid kinase [Bacillota bacterium]